MIEFLKFMLSLGFWDGLRLIILFFVITFWLAACVQTALKK